jgi:hypothetical protein
MIRHADVVARVAEWQLSHAVIEKDYVLGWLLWGIGSDATLRDAWVFKGGTCLKKCYFETYRFSEDLDFTVLPGRPVAPKEVEPVLSGLLERVAEASGLDFSVRPPTFRARPGAMSTEGSVYYRGPLAAPMPARVKLDLTSDERVVRPPVLRTIAHPYPDTLPRPATSFVRMAGRQRHRAIALGADLRRRRNSSLRSHLRPPDPSVPVCVQAFRLRWEAEAARPTQCSARGATGVSQGRSPTPSSTPIRTNTATPVATGTASSSDRPHAGRGRPASARIPANRRSTSGACVSSSLRAMSVTDRVAWEAHLSAGRTDSAGSGPS